MRHSKVKFLVLGLFVGSFFYYTTSVFGQAKTIVLTYSNLTPATYLVGVLTEEWAKEIEKKTDGMVRFRIFHGGTLTPPEQAYDGVVKGISDATSANLAWTMGRFPFTEILHYPWGFKDTPTAVRLVNEFFDKFRPKEFDDVKMLFQFVVPPRFLHSNKAVNRLEDIKGLKIRCTGIEARVATALGGTPVTMPITEAYDALSRGVVDSIRVSNDALESFKMAEVTKFTTEAFSVSTVDVAVGVINKAKWNAIPPNAQKVIEEVSKGFGEKVAKAYDIECTKGKEFALKLGHKFIRLSEEEEARWAKLITPMFDEYVREKKAKGLPAEEALKFCQERTKQLK
jgi:TRAP-type C4-dicarboxylate transport system substrate-binding protein